jgi:hypothetical protein
MDGLTKLLLAKYNPGKLQELPQEPVSHDNQEVPSPVAKSAPEALHAATGLTLVMSSADFPESVIFKALREFNTTNPQLMARSFTLPTITNGIPAGSWVFVTPEED